MIEHYWFRAVAISFASFAICYCAFSCAAWCSWLVVRRRAEQSHKFLFALLTAPVLLASAVVTFFVLPSFLFFEPEGDEAISSFVRVCSCFGIAIVVTSVVRAAISWLQTLRSVRRWTDGAVVTDLHADMLIVTTKQSAPAAVVAGIARPRLLISSATKQALTANEYRLVLAHEREHARRRDNLRKLVLSANPMPFLRAIEDRWMLACELAADRAAVADSHDACDLAAALVKVSRLTCAQPRWASAFGASTPDVLGMRIQQLVLWNAERPVRREVWVSDLSLALIGGTAGLLLVFAGDVLSTVHSVSEFWIN